MFSYVKNSCPTDSTIFPALENLSDGRTLVGRFDAFKFADDVVVRFQVNVHFCVGQCKPIQCNQPQSRNLIFSNNKSETIDSIDGNKSKNAFHENEIGLDHDLSPQTPSTTGSSEEDPTTVSDRHLGATVSRLFSRRKRSSLRNVVIENRSHQIKVRTHGGPKAPADAELRREIIVQGLSKNEEDTAAKLLYNRSEGNLS